eukprot:6206053-Pleurochrysis_carterae.AAC.1
MSKVAPDNNARFRISSELEESKARTVEITSGAMIVIPLIRHAGMSTIPTSCGVQWLASGARTMLVCVRLVARCSEE